MANCLTSMCRNLSRTIVIRIVALVVVVVIFGGVLVVILKFTRSDESIVIPEGLPSSEQYTRCKTQNGILGVCREEHNCRRLHEALTQAQCAQGMFCCAEPYALSPEDPGPRPNRSNNRSHASGGMCKMSLGVPDSGSRCCGIEANSIPKIIGGSPSRIDEYPWTAALEYERKGVSQVMCGGSLIGGRYVLTAAHCVDADGWTLKNVRLGDYNISNPGKDCVPIENGQNDCTDDVVIVPVEEIITHPNYNIPVKSTLNDIALIRLDRVVNYTDFVRPICLPSTDFTTTAPTNVTLYVAGWGSNTINTSTEIKVSVDLPYVPQEECQEDIGDGQFCAGGVRKKDTCAGDSGGPAMMECGTHMELVGIVSFGPKQCGTEGTPGVYTKVYAYLPWIRNQTAQTT